MQTLILKSESKKALNAIKTLAKILDIDSIINESEKENDFVIKKGVKISRPKRKLNVKEMAGSLTDLSFEEPSLIIKKAWTRKKATY